MLLQAQTRVALLYILVWTYLPSTTANAPITIKRVLEFGQTTSSRLNDDSSSSLKAKSRQTLILHSTLDDVTSSATSDAFIPCQNTTTTVLEEDEFLNDVMSSNKTDGYFNGISSSSMSLLTFLLSAAMHFRPKPDSQFVTDVIIVANGFEIGENAASAIYAMLEDSFVSVAFLSTLEFVGYAAGLNQAFDYIHNKKNHWSQSSHLVAIMDTSVTLYSDQRRVGRRNTLFDKYRDLAAQYGTLQGKELNMYNIVVYRSPLKPDLAKNTYRLTHQAPIPVIVMDVFYVIKTREGNRHPWKVFDDQYYFQPSLLDFLENQSSSTLVVVDLTQDMREIFQDNFLSTFPNNHSLQELSVGMERCMRAKLSHRQQLIQSDIDLYFIYTHLATNRRLLAASETMDEPIMNDKQSLSQYYAAPSLDLVLSSKQNLPFKVTAVVCVYDDTRFMERLLISLLPSLHHVIILISTTPWNGKPTRSTLHTLKSSHFLASTSEGKDKVSIIHGTWHSESEQRNFGNRVAMELGTDLVMILDGDEFWHPVQLERSFSLIANNLKTGTGLPPFVRSKMMTHFGSILSVVDPPEKLQILWLVSPNACRFTFAREIECFAGLRTSNEGLFFGPDTSQCFHLSYVRTTDEIINMKFASFEHHNEIDSASWIANVWSKWKVDPSVENLHPTHSDAYKRTRSIEVTHLPPSLRSFYFDYCLYENALSNNHEVNEMICSRHGTSSSSKLDCMLEEFYIQNLAEKIWDTLLAKPSTISLVADYHLLDTSKNMFSNKFRQYSDNTNVPQYLRAISRRSIKELDPSALENPEKALLDCENPRFLVLTVKEGNGDNSTEGTFEDISMILVEGIRKVLEKRANIKAEDGVAITATCDDLRLCQLSGERFVIVLGSHHLSRYTINGILQAAVKGDFPPRIRSALYNFEYINKQNDFEKEQNLSMWDIFDHYEKSVHGIWDYSISNYKQILEKNYNAKYVPLGYVDQLKWKDDDNNTRDIDVLFYGHINDYRINILSMLRESGITVRHVNAISGVYGNELNGFIKRSKIVLNLRYFDKKSEVPSGEWKMARFLRPLANARLIISEHCGDTVEVNKWNNNGVVFVKADELPATIKYYLQNKPEADDIAQRGQKLLQSQREEDILEPFLRDLVHNRCPTW